MQYVGALTLFTLAKVVWLSNAASCPWPSVLAVQASALLEEHPNPGSRHTSTSGNSYFSFCVDARQRTIGVIEYVDIAANVSDLCEA